MIFAILVLLAILAMFCGNYSYYHMHQSYLVRIGQKPKYNSFLAKYSFKYILDKENIDLLSGAWAVDPSEKEGLFLSYLYDKLNNSEKRLYWRGKIFNYASVLFFIAAILAWALGDDFGVP